MRLKVLTVDDSKTVRIIVKKAFKGFDCEIFEAQNGVEGLAMAAKCVPDIILLDITMPVMDGVEMLTKIKSDPALKSIPIIMLTAEAGRENVMKIAKIGVRDYIVKPFKEEVLIDKVSRVVDLRPAGEASPAQKKIDDPIDILIVEDKPAIVEQIKNGFSHTPTGEAIDYCQKKLPDCVMISLSLPEDAAITLFRIIRSNAKTKYVPLFGLSVKTASEEQIRAQQAGFSTIVHKPIDFEELEAKVAGISSVIFDAQEVDALNMDLIKLLLHSMKTCRDLSLTYALTGNPILREESKKFEESKDWKFCDTLESAKASF